MQGGKKVLFGALAAVVLFGIGFGGSPRAVAAGSSDSLLGDLSTLDACSLVPASGFVAPASLGKAKIKVTQGTQYSDCGIQVSVPQNGITDVDVNFAQAVNAEALAKPGSEARVTTEGKLKVVTPTKQGSGTCELGAATPDGTFIILQASPNNSTAAKVKPCTVADAVLADLVSTVRKAHTKHLHWLPGSLGSLKACTVLDPSAIAKLVPGITQHEQSLGDHTCTYAGSATATSGPGVLYSTYLFNQPQTLETAKAEASYAKAKFTGKQVTIDGHVSIVANLPGDPQANCQVTTTAKVWAKGFGNNSAAIAGITALPAVIYETPTITVTAPSVSQATLCQDAQGLAAQAWPKLGLPKAS